MPAKKDRFQLPNAYISDSSQIKRKVSAGPTPHAVETHSELYNQNIAESIAMPAACNLSAHSSDGSIAQEMARMSAKDTEIFDEDIKILTKIDSNREALCCKYSEEYDYIGVGYSDGVIKMYQSNTGNLIFSLHDQDVKDNRAPVTCIKHRAVSKSYPISNCYTATYANGCVKSWSYNFNQCLYTINEERQTFGLTYHPRFPKLITFGDDLKIYFYDEETRTQERVLSSSENTDVQDGPASRVFAACFNPKNNYELITGGWDNNVYFWDLRQPHAIRHISGFHICGEGLDMNHNGTQVLACSWQKNDPIQIIDYASGKTINSIDPDSYNSKLYCGKYATKDIFICAGSDPNLIRVVDQRNFKTLAMVKQLPGPVYSVDCGPTMRVKYEKPDVGLKEALSVVPKIVFVSARCLYQIDFEKPEKPKKHKK